MGILKRTISPKSPGDDITPEQIAAETAEIRAQWSDLVTATRAGRPTQKWSVPVVHCEDEFVRSQEIFW